MSDNHHLGLTQSAAFLQDPSTSTWSIVTAPKPEQHSDSPSDISNGSPKSPPRQMSKIPRVRPKLPVGSLSNEPSQRPRAMTDGEWWLGLAPPSPKKQEARTDLTASAPAKMKTGRGIIATDGVEKKIRSLAQSPSISSTDEGSSPLKGHSRDYSSDAITSHTTSSTDDKESMSDSGCDQSFLSGSVMATHIITWTKPQLLNRLIRMADLDTLAADLDDHDFSSQQLSAGIKHAYGLLQDQIIKRSEVKTQLQEDAGWRPEAGDLREESDAYRFREVCSKIPETEFDTWSAEEAKLAIQALVRKRLMVIKETENLRDVLRKLPGMREECEEEQRALQLKIADEDEVFEGMVVGAYLILMLTALSILVHGW